MSSSSFVRRASLKTKKGPGPALALAGGRCWPLRLTDAPVGRPSDDETCEPSAGYDDCLDACLTAQANNWFEDAPTLGATDIPNVQGR